MANKKTKIASKSKVSNRSVKPTTKITHHTTSEGYFLKLVLFLILSSIWLRISYNDATIPLPVGAFLALPYAFHEHFQIDRKIELALILVGMFVAFWLPIGVYVTI